MDYLSQPLRLKLKKVIRYTLLYGPSRTFVKVMGQRHMRCLAVPPVAGRREINTDQFVGIIGCGNYAFTTIAYYLTKRFGKVVGICMDRNPGRAASLSRYYGVPVWTADGREVTANDRIRLVYVASNHASHAEYAIDALEHGKHVYVEKPHVVSEDQLVRLVETMGRTSGKVFLGFNRPGSRFGRIIREYLAREPGPGMYNWFIAGHELEPDHWYFKPEEGGRVLGNLCHWTDFVLRLVPVGAYPIRIRPTSAGSRESNIAVTFTFADETIAVISFSTKGHTFEGVRERFNAHKGSCLIAMDDFRRLTIDRVEAKRRWFNLYRDHGHRRNILRAYESVAADGPYDRAVERAHVWNTGWLFLKTREALETGRQVMVYPFDEGHPTPAGVEERGARGAEAR